MLELIFGSWLTEDKWKEANYFEIALKYNSYTKEPVIKKLERISKPGLRKYSDSISLPRVLNGLGIAIVSTSKGLMTGKKAKQSNVGGEILCYVH